MSDDMAPRWIPKTEAELWEAVEGGVLVEDHHRDFKAEFAQGNSANKNMAIDLASFAVDGGVLVIGVDEKASPRLVPVPLGGLPERIDQVARSRIDPPLSVTTRSIQSADVPGCGYVVVTIPASPAAPHAVEHVYRGRSDTTNIPLPDAEIRRIRDERRRAEADAYDLLALAIERDPAKDSPSGHPHLFVVAQPVYSDPEMLVRVLGDNPAQTLARMVMLGPQLTQDYYPDFFSAGAYQRRAQGWAVYKLPDQPDPRAPHEDDGLEVLVQEDGGLRVFCGRAGDFYNRGGGMMTLMPSVVGGLVWRTVHLAHSIAGLMGYVGNWQMGVGITRLRGARGVQSAGVLPTPYSEDDYRAVATVTFAHLEEGPDAVVDRLLGRLGRALGGRVEFPRRKA